MLDHLQNYQNPIMNVLLVLLSIETGKTVSRAISSLQEHGVRVEKIILVTLFATPQGEKAVFSLQASKDC